MLVPLQVKVEQCCRQRLCKGPLPQRLVVRLGALLDEAAEPDTGMAIAMGLPRLRGFVKQLLENPLGEAAAC